MKLDQFFIGILILSLMIVSGTFVFQGLINEYDINTTTEEMGFTDVYDVSDELFSDVSAVKNQTLRPDVEGADESEDSLLKGGFQAIKLVPTSFNLVRNIINAVALNIGIPSYFITFIILFFMIAIIFAVLAFIFRTRG